MTFKQDMYFRIDRVLSTELPEGKICRLVSGMGKGRNYELRRNLNARGINATFVAAYMTSTRDIAISAEQLAEVEVIVIDGYIHAKPDVRAALLELMTNKKLWPARKKYQDDPTEMVALRDGVIFILSDPGNGAQSPLLTAEEEALFHTVSVDA